MLCTRVSSQWGSLTSISLPLLIFRSTGSLLVPMCVCLWGSQMDARIETVKSPFPSPSRWYCYMRNQGNRSLEVSSFSAKLEDWVLGTISEQ